MTSHFLAIFGNPVAHSKSPLIHNYFFKKMGTQLGVKGCYTRYQLEKGEEIKEKFLQLGLTGANVTIPFKREAFLYADRVEGIAQKMGVVNTLVRRGDEVVGYNTDAPGFLEAVKEFKFENVLLIGAGGSAKALSWVLENVEVVNRSSGRLDYFKKRGIPAYSWEEFTPKSYDLVVNTTSAGLTDNSLPLPEPMAREVLKRAKYLVDIIYGKETPIMKLAKEMGLQVKGGEEMLIYQGVLAMEHFLNRPLPREKVASLYREILRG